MVGQAKEISASGDKVKIRFKIDPDYDPVIKTEDMWAQPLGAAEFKLLNSPFYAFDISAEDIVIAESEEGVLWFKEVVSRGGHSTYRVFMQGGRTIQSPEFEKFWNPVAGQGATYENANSRFIAIDTPPGTDLRRIFSLLQQGEDAGIWAFEEVCCQ